MNTFRFDTETYLTRPGLLAPKIVCLQYAIDDDTPGRMKDGVITILSAKTAIHSVLKANLNEALFEGHNTAFDLGVICANFPDLTPLVFKMLAEGRGRDTMLREVLIEIANGNLQEDDIKSFSLASIAKKRLFVEVKKDDTWRLDYALLDDVPVDQWPADAIEYAHNDVRFLRDISRHQLKEFVPPDEWAQVCGAFALQLAAIWGVHTDPDKVREQQTRFDQERTKMQTILMNEGFMSDEGKIVQAKVRKAVEDACITAEREIPRTDKGAIKIDKDTCELLKEFNPALEALSRHNTANKMLATYLEPLSFGSQYAMTSRPNPLVATGRTSWGGGSMEPYSPWWPKRDDYIIESQKVGTNMQNFPQMPGIRECVVPRPGFYFASVDYSSLELRTLGQACLWLVGKSTLAQGYQRDVDWDPHTYFAGQLINIDYETALRRKAEDKNFKKGPRQVAKAANFSLPGGVGARKLSVMFKKLYEQGQLAQPYSEDDCREIRSSWLQAYPEMQDYFELASYYSESNKPITQLVSNRVRGGVRFTSCCNSFFQGLAADLAKRALFYVSQACYVEPKSPLFGSRVVAFIHDEIIAEVPIDRSSDAAFEISRLMNKAYAEFCPDVPGASEPALMTHWTKKAEFKLDENKRLIPSH